MNHSAFRNNQDTFLSDALAGLIANHPDARWHDVGFIGRTTPLRTADGDPAVVVISGGGSGHEPMHAGFVGQGMLAAACPGLLFTSPNAVQVSEATQWADQGRGVVHVVKNYTGDVMNFTVARNAVEAVDTRTVLVADDLATDGNEDGPGRRGTGATILVEKVAGAAAYRGDDVDKVAELGQRAADNSRSMSVALGAGFMPTTGRETFDLDAGQMEVGVGIHGEPGTHTEQVGSASAIVSQVLDKIAPALELGQGDEVVCLVNGLGGTTPLELSLLFGEASAQLAQRGITVARSLVGSYVTAVNMHGASFTLLKADAELLELIDAPTSAPAWPHTLGGAKAVEPATITFQDELPSEGEENQWLTAFVERLQASFESLTELDRKAGDGDFGQNMEAAFGGIELPLRGTDTEILTGLAKRLLVLAGGTSGAVFGTLFNELARAETLADGLNDAADLIHELGGAKRGDRTMLDALIPAAEKARELGAKDPDAETLQTLFDAAHAGALDTEDLAAKKGRASYLGDRSKGVIDPGAIVVSWLFGGEPLSTR